jgi:hypothetical protein
MSIIMVYAGGFGSWEINYVYSVPESRSQNFMARILSLLYCITSFATQVRKSSRERITLVTVQSWVSTLLPATSTVKQMDKAFPIVYCPQGCNFLYIHGSVDV